MRPGAGAYDDHNPNVILDKMIDINYQSSLTYIWLEYLAGMPLREGNIVTIHFAFSGYFTNRHLISPSLSLQLL